MFLEFKNLTIRNATINDATLLAAWWNDGKIMAHAGFPLGTGETSEEIAKKISKDADEVHRRLIIELDSIPMGEMSYYNVGDDTAEIGIKICDFSKHDKGYGKVLLSMLIASLFSDMGYKKIILDTNLNNKRAQHVYEELGFKQVRINMNCWKNQVGELQSSIDYELYQEDFVNFAKEEMEIRRIENNLDKRNISRLILESLNEWFEIPEAREEYILDSHEKPFFCAFDKNRPIGFVYLKETGKDTVELAVMGVLKEYHRLGIGSKLFAEAKKEAFLLGYSFLQVKTVQMGKYYVYDNTNKFYLSLGFKEL